MMQRLSALDRAAFARVAATRWPGAEPVLPRLSRSANHGMLWFGAAAAMAALGGRPGRRSAARGVASLALASATVNTVAKATVRRARPLLDAVPVVRRLRRQPFTTSFPSGHAASAAAFATGVAFESPRLGALLAPVAASVAFSRVYTGVHYPSDVLAGAALGAGAAVAVHGLLPSRKEVPPPRAAAPALPGGEGLTVVVNAASGPPSVLASPAERLASLLPRAKVVEGTEQDDLGELLEKAARQAAERGGALGVCGGDGTVNTAAAVASRLGVPLAVFPGGTRNHLAKDLGMETFEDTARAVDEGNAAAIDLGWFCEPGGERKVFVNTFSIGPYPELVRIRERWSRRVGAWPATVLAAVHVLRTARPVPVRINGRPRSVWLLFAGNCTYRSLGPAPMHRRDLADGLLDVRVVNGGRLARTRLMTAALTGALTRSPVYWAAPLRRLRVGMTPESRDGRNDDAGAHLSFDGEVAPAPEELTIGKANSALTVYRPSVVSRPRSGWPGPARPAPGR